MTGPTTGHTPQQTVERALELSKADGCVVIADEGSSANLRWANNTLTTNGVTRTRRLTVIATLDGGTGVSAGVVTRSSITDHDLERSRRRPPSASSARWPRRWARRSAAPGPGSGPCSGSPSTT
jgi:hypothetical protein